MRIIILSIALLFCAFTAQSQVLKSAGVWYFLDVDSMTARPAVLPNGTELAYVIGTKTVYYWNRNTSTWTAYGSTFNRDSIYFDASIIGSGTVGDPWRVDSTLFATIAGVGDSIELALLGYLPIEGGTLTGTGGAGFIGFPSQVSAPGTPASGLNVYAQGSSFNWKGTDGYERQFASTLTGGRTYTLPDVSGTFALGTGTADRSARWSATNTLAAGNFTDNGTKVQALLPFQLQQWTTAGRPTGVTGYEGYNTTGNGKEWYNGTRWAYALESTFARGTANRIPFFDANGQLTDNAALSFPNTTFTISKDAGSGLGNATSVFILNTNATSLKTQLVFGGNVSSRWWSFGTDPLGVGTNGFFLYANGAANTPIWATTDSKVRIGYIGLVTGGLTNPYTLSIDGTDGVQIPDGTVSQRPTIIANTNPFRYNTDSTALEYGVSAGSAWFQLATRAYARGLSFYGANGALASNRTVTGGSFWLNLDANTGIKQSGPTQELDVNGDAYIRDSTRLTTTPSHSSITGLLTRDANGWVGAASLAGGLSYSGGVLSAAGAADGNGIYSNSATLANHTTRARIPSTGNLLFSQTYNSTDSAYIQVINGLGGNREVRGGLTDTVSTGYSTFRFYQDEGDEEMGFDLRSLDGTGDTQVLAQGGNIRVIGSNIATLESTGEVRLLGLVRAKQEAYAEITSTSSPQTLSSTYSDNLINQGGTQATFTLKFPASPVDGQVLKITYNNAITTLTLDGNGNTIVGSAVTTGVAGSQRAFKFYTGIGWIKQY